jgi:hypothetical protein
MTVYLSPFTPIVLTTMDESTFETSLPERMCDHRDSRTIDDVSMRSESAAEHWPNGAILRHRPATDLLW